MAKLVRRHWSSDYPSGLPRADRAICDYDAYVPDGLAGRTFTIDGEVAADLADAEAALVRFDSRATALADTEALARLLLRAESVASSRIEGLEVGGRRLLHADAQRHASTGARRSADVTAVEVLNNVDVMVWAAATIGADDSITVENLLEAHRRLLTGTRLDDHAGRIRTEQNWLGGSSFNPCRASYVPPPPDDVPELLEDLCGFCNDDSLSATAQAAVAHAQFETIHPFVDGNGRIGRALIHMVLRRRGVTHRVSPPISLILGTWADAYVDGLTATRYVGDSDGLDATAGVNRWLGLFATATRRAVEDATDFEGRIDALRAAWRGRLGRVRADSATDRLLEALPGIPVLTVESASDRIGRTYQATNEAVRRLVAHDVLRQTTLGRRNRAFEAPEVIAAFTDFERRLTSPVADTSVAPPHRPVPRRR